MNEPWKCPHDGCPKEIADPDPAIVRIRVASHQKDHDTTRPESPAPWENSHPSRKETGAGWDGLIAFAARIAHKIVD